MNSRRASTLVLVLAACGGTAPPAVPATPTATASAAPTDTAPIASAAPTETAPTPTASASAAPPPTPAPVEQNIPIVPFKLVSTEKGGEVIMELKADGTIVDKDGTAKGKIDGRSVTFDGLTEALFVVEKDGSVAWAFAKSAKVRFDEKDALTVEDGKKKGKLVIDDKGKITITGNKGSESPPWRVEPMSPGARRAAALLSMSVSRPKKKK